MNYILGKKMKYKNNILHRNVIIFFPYFYVFKAQNKTANKFYIVCTTVHLQLMHYVPSFESIKRKYFALFDY